MRDPMIVEEELIEIAGTPDDGTKLEQIISWCAVHPDEVPIAIRILMGRMGRKSNHANIR
jgi:hypothetical protein